MLFFFLYCGIGSASTSIATYIFGSSRVYHSVFHTGEQAHLGEDYRSDYFCLCYVCYWVGLLKSLLVVALSCMMSNFAIDKGIAWFFDSWVLNLVCCIGFGLRVLLYKPIVIRHRFVFYHINLKGQFFSFLNLIPILVLLFNLPIIITSSRDICYLLYTSCYFYNLSKIYKSLQQIPNQKKFRQFYVLIG